MGARESLDYDAAHCSIAAQAVLLLCLQHPLDQADRTGGAETRYLVQ